MSDLERENFGDMFDDDLDGEREGELLAKLVHDLKNPLGIIASFAEEVPLAEEGERRDFCQRLVVNARRALRVLDDFGLVSDLRRGRIALTLVPCDWSLLVGQGLAEVAEIARESEQELLREQDGELPIVGDASLLRSALGSLFRETLAGIGKRRRVHVEIREEGELASVRITIPDRADGFSEGSPFVREAIGFELARRIFELHEGSFLPQKTEDATVALVRIPRLPGVCKGSA
jgi:signal transduction histidine kinase